MTAEAALRETMCLLARSMFDRGLTGGSTGNISARTGDGGLLVSPTGTSFGRLDPARLSRFDAAGRLVDGDPPTKEMPLHSAFYDTRSSAGCAATATQAVSAGTRARPSCPASSEKLTIVVVRPWKLPSITMMLA